VFKDLVTKKVVHDVKCSWNAETFMSATPDVNYRMAGKSIWNYGMQMNSTYDTAW
jgi:hypothetical protein